MTTIQPEPWYSVLPTPISQPPPSTPQEVHDLLHTPESGETILIVDVRRADIEGDAAYMIPRAINLPAQTFFASLPTLLPILSSYTHVIFHCSSSRGRGPRCAGWYQDTLDSHSIEHSKSYVLEGGIKAWKEAFPEEVIPVLGS